MTLQNRLALTSFASMVMFMKATCRSFSFNCSNKKSGFTLVELLVVIAIIGILSASLLFTLGPLLQGANSVKQAAGMASDYFNLARTEAIRQQTYSALLIDANTTNSTTYLHRMLIATWQQYDTTGASLTTPYWQMTSKWIYLPQGVYFYANYSAASYNNAYSSLPYPGNTSLSAQPVYDVPTGGSPSIGNLVFQAPAYSYIFQPTGNLTLPPTANNTTGLAQFILVSGVVSNGALTALDGGISRFGFVLHTFGRATFYQNVTDITTQQ